MIFPKDGLDQGERFNTGSVIERFWKERDIHVR